MICMMESIDDGGIVSWGKVVVCLFSTCFCCFACLIFCVCLLGFVGYGLSAMGWRYLTYGMEEGKKRGPHKTEEEGGEFGSRRAEKGGRSDVIDGYFFLLKGN